MCNEPILLLRNVRQCVTKMEKKSIFRTLPLLAVVFIPRVYLYITQVYTAAAVLGVIIIIVRTYRSATV